jgi:hypothetical protein
VIVLSPILINHSNPVEDASSMAKSVGDSLGSVASPVPPDYIIDQHGYVTLRVCLNWSRVRRQTMTVTPDDIDLLKSRMAIYSRLTLKQRLQRVGIGIWEMELLAQ